MSSLRDRVLSSVDSARAERESRAAAAAGSLPSSDPRFFDQRHYADPFRRRKSLLDPFFPYNLLLDVLSGVVLSDKLRADFVAAGEARPSGPLAGPFEKADVEAVTRHVFPLVVRPVTKSIATSFSLRCLERVAEKVASGDGSAVERGRWTREAFDASMDAHDLAVLAGDRGWLAARWDAAFHVVKNVLPRPALLSSLAFFIVEQFEIVYD